MSSRKDSIEKVVEYVKSQDQPVSVKDIAEALGISRSYARTLAVEALDQGLFDGRKATPVIGYIFSQSDRARTDGGESQGELRVLTTRESLLQAVRDHAPAKVSEARDKHLEELRTFVRDQVADGTTVVSRAWEFEG